MTCRGHSDWSPNKDDFDYQQTQVGLSVKEKHSSNNLEILVLNLGNLT